MKAARLKLRKTQWQVAADLGVSQPSYAEWEAGKVNPRTDRIVEIAAYFKIKAELLLPGKKAA